MNPDSMIEQLLAASDYWDKFSKTLSGAQKRKDEDLPFTPYGKKQKGGSGGGGNGAASGSVTPTVGGTGRRGDVTTGGLMTQGQDALLEVQVAVEAGVTTLGEKAETAPQHLTIMLRPTPLTSRDGKLMAHMLRATFSGSMVAPGSRD
jgi:hypothetical protein